MIADTLSSFSSMSAGRRTEIGIALLPSGMLGLLGNTAYDSVSLRRGVGDVLLALHLHEARDGALEFEAAVAFDIDFLRRHLGGDDQQGARLIERIDQDMEALRLVAPGRRQARHAFDEDRGKALGQRQI